MKTILKIFTFTFILITLGGFKSKEKYLIVNKKINEREFNFAIPESFCEYESPVNNLIQFVKCYEIDLQKDGLLSYFSEKILIAVETDNKYLQNVTDEYFAKSQLNEYKKLDKEQKNNYFYNENFPYNNKQRVFIKNDAIIFNKTGYNEKNNILQFFQSNLFLNKNFVIINWSQYLTDKEKPIIISKDKFSDFIDRNKKINKNDDILLHLNKNLRFLITKPKFDDFINYTDIKENNLDNFNALYYNVFNKDTKKDNKVIIINLLRSERGIEEVYNYSIKNEDKNNATELIKFKDMNIIKVNDINNNSTRYGTYIDLYDNLKLFLVIKIDGVNNKESKKGIQYLYEYKNQLINDNK